MKTVASHGRLSISGLGWSCSATFVVLFVLCMLAALFVPLRLAHGWIGLWSDAPIDSSRVWIDGLIWSVVVGWLVADAEDAVVAKDFLADARSYFAAAVDT